MQTVTFMPNQVLLVAVHLVPAHTEFPLQLSIALATEMHFGIHPGLPHQSAFAQGAESSLHAADRGPCLEELS